MRAARSRSCTTGAVVGVVAALFFLFSTSVVEEIEAQRPQKHHYDAMQKTCKYYFQQNPYGICEYDGYDQQKDWDTECYNGACTSSDCCKYKKEYKETCKEYFHRKPHDVCHYDGYNKKKSGATVCHSGHDDGKCTNADCCEYEQKDETCKEYFERKPYGICYEKGYNNGYNNNKYNNNEKHGNWNQVCHGKCTYKDCCTHNDEYDDNKCHGKNKYCNEKTCGDYFDRKSSQGRDPKHVCEKNDGFMASRYKHCPSKGDCSSKVCCVKKYDNYDHHQNQKCPDNDKYCNEKNCGDYFDRKLSQGKNPKYLCKKEHAYMAPRHKHCPSKGDCSSSVCCIKY